MYIHSTHKYIIIPKLLGSSPKHKYEKRYRYFSTTGPHLAKIAVRQTYGIVGCLNLILWRYPNTGIIWRCSSNLWPINVSFIYVKSALPPSSIRFYLIQKLIDINITFLYGYVGIIKLYLTDQKILLYKRLVFKRNQSKSGWDIIDADYYCKHSYDKLLKVTELN